MYRLHHEEFSGLVRKIDEKKNAYEVDILFNMSMFESFVASTFVSICRSLIQLLGQEVIRITYYNENFEETDVLDAGSLKRWIDAGPKGISQTHYFSLAVIDLQNLAAKNGLDTVA